MTPKTLDRILWTAGGLIIAAIVFSIGYQVLEMYLSSRGNHSLPSLSFLPALGFLILLLPIYFLPTLIAADRKAAPLVLILNILFGWTVIVWIVALLVALSSPRVR